MCIQFPTHRSIPLLPDLRRLGGPKSYMSTHLNMSRRNKGGCGSVPSYGSSSPPVVSLQKTRVPPPVYPAPIRSPCHPRCLVYQWRTWVVLGAGGAAAVRRVQAIGAMENPLVKGKWHTHRSRLKGRKRKKIPVLDTVESTAIIFPWPPL